MVQPLAGHCTVPELVVPRQICLWRKRDPLQHLLLAAFPANKVFKDMKQMQIY